MSQKTSVVRNRITIDDRVYDAKALGGGKFAVTTSKGDAIGSFSVRGGTIEVEQLEVEGADPVELIGSLWVRENLSGSFQTRMAQAKGETPPSDEPKQDAKPIALGPQVATQKPIEARPIATAASEPKPFGAKPIDERALAANPVLGKTLCRIATHGKPEPAAIEKAKLYLAWLRNQPGVLSAYLTRDAATGNTLSVALWESQEMLAAMRYAVPPTGAAQLPVVRVELMVVVG